MEYRFPSLYIQISRAEIYTFCTYFKIKFVRPPLARFAQLGVTVEEESEMTTHRLLAHTDLLSDPAAIWIVGHILASCEQILSTVCEVQSSSPPNVY